MGSLQVFPNPTNDKITISVKDAINNKYQIKLVDITGKILITQGFRGQTSIDVQKIPSGIYLIELIKDGQIFANKKVIIQH